MKSDKIESNEEDQLKRRELKNSNLCIWTTNSARMNMREGGHIQAQSHWMSMKKLENNLKKYKDKMTPLD